MIGPLWTMSEVCGGSGRCLAGWSPGVAGEGPVYGGHDVDAVLAGGVDVAADVEPVLGCGFAGQAAGDFLLRFGGPQVSLADVVRGPNPGVGGEAQNVGLAAAAELQQLASGALRGGVPGP